MDIYDSRIDYKKAFITPTIETPEHIYEISRCEVSNNLDILRCSSHGIFKARYGELGATIFKYNMNISQFEEFITITDKRLGLYYAFGCFLYIDFVFGSSPDRYLINIYDKQLTYHKTDLRVLSVKNGHEYDIIDVWVDTETHTLMKVVDDKFYNLHIPNLPSSRYIFNHLILAKYDHTKCEVEIIDLNNTQNTKIIALHEGEIMRYLCGRNLVLIKATYIFDRPHQIYFYETHRQSYKLYATPHKKLLLNDKQIIICADGYTGCRHFLLSVDTSFAIPQLDECDYIKVFSYYRRIFAYMNNELIIFGF